MSARDGGPAFPMPIAGCNDGSVYNTLEQSRGELGGMSLRDYFAGMVLQGYCAVNTGRGLTNNEVAESAYEVADAMLKAREAKP